MKLPIEILLVDDEKEFAETLAERLTARGHRVRVAFDGPQALEALKQRPFDAVILDLFMPGMDGLATMREMKARQPLVEVILLTGHGSVDTAVAGLKNGAFDYVLKPAKFEELLEKLQAARQRKAEQEERIRQAEARSLTRRTGDI